VSSGRDGQASHEEEARDGGPATAAAIGSPVGVVAGSGGSVLFADAFNNRIRMVSG
jgi:hypothetical protein